MDEKTTIIMHLPYNQSEEIVLDGVLFGGIIGDGSGYPVGGYNGNLDIGKTTISMVHTIRAYLKLCEEQGLSLEQAKTTLDFCVKEAINKEQEGDPLDNVDLDTHMIKIRKDNK
jgi:hypothetical protein